MNNDTGAKPLNRAVITYLMWAAIDFGMILLIAIIVIVGFTAHSAETKEITVYLGWGVISFFAISIISKIAYGLHLEKKLRQKKEEEQLSAIRQALEPKRGGNRTTRDTALAKLTEEDRVALGL